MAILQDLPERICKTEIYAIAPHRTFPTHTPIICSRSFGTNVHSLNDLEEAVASYASRAAEKLRHDGSHVSVTPEFTTSLNFKADIVNPRWMFLSELLRQETKQLSRSSIRCI